MFTVNSESCTICKNMNPTFLHNSFHQMNQSSSVSIQPANFDSSDPNSEVRSVVSSKYGSLTSLLNNNKKKRKHI